MIQAFASDDVLFNLLGLYDYWSNLVGFAFIGTSRKKIGWRGLATSALDKKNPFSSTAIGPMIAEHHKQWALKLQDLRAEIIHYEHLEGKSRYEISWQAGNEAAFEFLSTLPTPISKKLQLQAPARGDLGVDLQLGLIEICKKSIIWLAEATKLACEQLTRHTVRERASQETPSK